MTLWQTGMLYFTLITLLMGLCAYVFGMTTAQLEIKIIAILPPCHCKILRGATVRCLNVSDHAPSKSHGKRLSVLPCPRCSRHGRDGSHVL